MDKFTLQEDTYPFRVPNKQHDTRTWLELKLVVLDNETNGFLIREDLDQTEICLSELDLNYKSQINILQDDVSEFVRYCIVRVRDRMVEDEEDGSEQKETG